MKFILLSKEMTKTYCEKILMPKGAIEIMSNMAEEINNNKKLFDIYNEFYESYIYQKADIGQRSGNR
jgi:hypothetical protein